MKNIIGYLLHLAFFFFVTVQISNVHAQGFKLEYCAGSSTQLKTAIGCIETTPTGFASTLLKLSLGIAGGIAFLMILLGGLQVQTSAGNPERINQGREIIEGAIIGLLLIIFSIFILKVVGVDILGIPNFS